MTTDLIQPLSSIIRSTAQQELIPRFRKVAAHHKDDGSLVTEADLAMQQAVAHQLQQLCPDIAFLGEEMPAEQHQRLLNDQSEKLWILDPLDGTINFAAGIPLFSVSLALVDEQGVALGIIYDPIHDELFSAQRGQGTRLNNAPLATPQLPQQLDECVAEIDLKRLSEPMRQDLLHKQPFRSQRNFGSGALDWAWLAAGRFPLYLHGGQKLWDYAAGVLILQEAGGVSATLEGEAVFNRKLPPRSVVAASNATLFSLWSNCLT